MLTHKSTAMLETERLILRKANSNDVEPMFRNWACDPEVTKFLTWPAHGSLDISRMVIDSWIHGYEEEN